MHKVDSKRMKCTQYGNSVKLCKSTLKLVEMQQDTLKCTTNNKDMNAPKYDKVHKMVKTVQRCAELTCDVPNHINVVYIQ